MLSTLPSFSWSDLKSPWDPPKFDEMYPPNPDNNIGFHYDEILASKLRQHQINDGGGSSPVTTAMKMTMQQQMMLAGRAIATDGRGLTMPLSLGSGAAGSHHNDIDDGSSFKSPNHQEGEGFTHHCWSPMHLTYFVRPEYLMLTFMFIFRTFWFCYNFALISLIAIGHFTSFGISKQM